MTDSPRILAIGAHPDDCEARAGGTAALWARSGFTVRFLSATNGDAGHHEMSGEALAERRKVEADRSAEALGIEAQVLDNHDGQLVPSLEAREDLTRAIRAFNPDLILTHRPNDYHPDHRYTSQLVQDCCFMVVVPNFCPDTPAMTKNPCAMYVADSFQKPLPFQADIAVDIEPVLEEKIACLAAHESQLFEWLPWLDGSLDRVQAGPEARREYIAERIIRRYNTHEATNQVLARTYGSERAARIRYVEAFEACEYGSPVDEQALRRFFPFAFAD